MWQMAEQFQNDWTFSDLWYDSMLHFLFLTFKHLWSFRVKSNNKNRIFDFKVVDLIYFWHMIV